MNCPECGTRCLPVTGSKTNEFWCHPCQKHRFPPAVTETNASAPSPLVAIGPNPSQTEKPGLPDALAWAGSEKKLVGAIVNALRADGYIVWQISQRGGKHSGTTVGTPDLFIARPGCAIAFPVEVKTLEGDLSDEQEEFWRQGVSVVVRSVEAARAAVCRQLG